MRRIAVLRCFPLAREGSHKAKEFEMKSKAFTLPGVEVMTFGSTSSSRVGTSHSSSFTVTNAGTLHGDHKSPNAIAFNRIEQSVTRAAKMIRNAGYDSQHWDGNCMDTLGFSSSVPYPCVGADGIGVLRDRAVAKINSKLRGSSNVVVDLAESAQTIHMLRESSKLTAGFTSIVDLILGKYTRRLKRVTRVLRNASGSGYHAKIGKGVQKQLAGGLTVGQQRLDFATSKYLEWRYGWQPLVYSLYDAYDNLMRTQLSTVREFVERAGNVKDFGAVFNRNGVYVSHPVNVRETLSERIVVHYKFMLPTTGIWDWTSLNPASIAWELLPLSFVADWVWTIGQSLQNLENYWLWRSQFQGGYETYTIKREQWATCNSTWSALPPIYSGQLATEAVAFDGYISYIAKERNVVTSLPVPRGPQFRVKLGAKQLLDSAALLHQFIGKRFR